MRERGFTLVEIVVVLLILGVLIAMAASITRGVAASQRISLTTTRVNGASAAIAQFVMVARRLPCPADGQLPSNDANAGLERRDGAGDCLDAQQRGVVPWRSLGLTEEQASDAYASRLTYRVATALTRNEALNFSQCDPAAYRPPPPAAQFTAVGAPPYQACAPRCTPTQGSPCCSNATLETVCTKPSDMVTGRGFEMRTAAGVSQGTGVAYMILSHGANMAGSFAVESGKPNGVTPGPPEAQNVATAPLAAFYVEGPESDDPAAYFDDIIARKDVMQAAQGAGLGPRY